VEDEKNMRKAALRIKITFLARMKLSLATLRRNQDYVKEIKR